jgi:hypothetical protein
VADVLLGIIDVGLNVATNITLVGNESRTADVNTFRTIQNTPTLFSGSVIRSVGNYHNRRQNNVIHGGTPGFQLPQTFPNINEVYGSPEGVLTGVIGSTALRVDGGTGTSQYFKESGTGNTGWVAK